MTVKTKHHNTAEHRKELAEAINNVVDGTTPIALNIITGSPASNGTGTAGDIQYDATYIYVCTATDTWERVALTGGY